MAGKNSSGGGGGAGGGRPIIIIKKKGGHGGHHGGAWKVAYADFVTAMMALFMVLWLVSQTDQVDRDVISHYFRTGVFPDGGTSLLEQGEGMHAGNVGMIESSNTLIEARSEQAKMEKGAHAVREAVAQKKSLKEILENIQVRTIERGLLIEIVDGGKDMLFELSSSELKPKLIELLKAIAPALQSLHNPIEIHGHTDGRPFPKGAAKDNWVLSFERAIAARKILVEAGVDDERFAGVFAHGSTDPLKPDDLFAPENRRISILAVRMKDKKKGGLSGSPTVTQETIEKALEREAAAKNRRSGETKERGKPEAKEPVAKEHDAASEHSGPGSHETHGEKKPAE
jgi:chemotaxis protein MotB